MYMYMHMYCVLCTYPTSYDEVVCKLWDEMNCVNHKDIVLGRVDEIQHRLHFHIQIQEQRLQIHRPIQKPNNEKKHFYILKYWNMRHKFRFYSKQKHLNGNPAFLRKIRNNRLYFKINVIFFNQDGNCIISADIEGNQDGSCII